MSGDERALNAIVKKLVQHLRENMPGVDSVIEGFPAANQDLDFPSVTVHLKSPDFRLHSPYNIKKTVPSQGSKGSVLQAYGYYDIAMQVDLWAEYRPQLRTLMEEFAKMFNPNFDETGISLVLDEYFDQAVTYSLAGSVNVIEGEQVSQRNEWRATAQVLTGCRAIKEHMEYFIHEIDNQLTTPDEIESPDEEDYFGIV